MQRWVVAVALTILKSSSFERFLEKNVFRFPTLGHLSLKSIKEKDIFFFMKVFCVFSLESPHRGDSNEYTQCTIFNNMK